MTKNYTVSRFLAILAGFASAGAVLYMILEAAIKTGHWGLDDKLLPVIVGLTIVAGHLITPAIRDRKALAAVGWTVLAILGTGLTVYTSVGRQARVADTAAARSADVETQRAAITASLAKAELMLAEEQAALAKECASGKGKRCDGVKASVDV